METKLSLSLHGEIPDNCELALNELAQELNICLCENGMKIFGVKGDNLSVDYNLDVITITWKQPIHFYRALSLLPRPLIQFSKHETQCFGTLGIMFDVSRNAVLKPETVKFFLRKMALMGFNLGMMYTEDTYEVPNQPYIGYQRGRYSIKELRELDDYANIFGIELCPCIQTLGHLNRMLHWPALAHLKDNEEIILADCDESYVFLEELITAASMPYRSKKIHLGMDEAHGLGLGRHMQKFGCESPHTIIKRHLGRVLEITRRHNLSPMIWSDMYFRPDSPDNGYYNSGEPSANAKEAVFADVPIIYWDYYHNTEKEYSDMLEKHAQLQTQTYFAGGVWTWTGPALDYDKTIRTTMHALNACKKANVPFVLATAWGDNGAECNMTAALLGFQIYAEFCYSGKYCAENLQNRFKSVCHADADAFLELSRFNTVDGMRAVELRPVNAVKFLLYQDPLVQLYSQDMKGLALEKHYQKLAEDYLLYKQQNPEFEQLFDFYVKLATVLCKKCHWHENASKAVVEKNIELALSLVENQNKLIDDIETLRNAWRALWESTNRPHGFEIIDMRLGGVRARAQTAAIRMAEFASGRVKDIPELSETPLAYTKTAEGCLMGSYAINEIVSASKIDI